MTLEQLNDFNEHISSLRKYAELLIDEHNKQQPPRLGRWKPVMSERYWVISEDGYIHQKTWEQRGRDARYFSMYNCFQTEAEAQQEALRTIARRKLEWLARELNSTAMGRCAIGFIESKPCGIYSTTPQKIGEIRFASFKDAETAISQMTQEELEALR